MFHAMATALLYGATGYTGRLITRIATEYGIHPILAGRNREAVAALAHEHGLEHRAFALDDAVRIDRALDGVSAVLHCAGPFVHTSEPIASACIRTGVHYLDITGEVDVIERLHARDAEARTAGVMLLPGAGFDVVPSDCLAAHLKQRLPGATHLALAIGGSGRLSRGTASTGVERAGGGGVIRRHGKLTRVALGANTREIDFGFGPAKAVAISWGDVATAYYSTGIPNVEVFAVAPRRMRQVMLLTRHLGWLLRSRPVKNLLLRKIRAGPAGPSESELRTGKSYVWGQVADEQGNTATARFIGPNGYLLTAHTALLVLLRVLAGDFRAGFQTPSLAYGADFILQAPNVRREDL
jgi:short subunit dehydrogenase-like uncharacterized protein